MTEPEFVDSKIKKYIDANVYEMAKKRIKHIINTFDHIEVAFSGGKDSLVVLNLVDEVYKEMGITEKVNVFFRDEELIPDDVINFVQSHYHSGRFNFRYFCIPLKSNKFILGDSQSYIQWDTKRKHIREIPSFAITSKDTFDQYTADEYITRGIKGKIAIINGIRADESLIRWHSIINKKNESHISATKIANVKMVKPLYDWTQSDIFKYLYIKKIPYCVIYDKQMWNSEQLRVASPLHSESAKKLYKLRATYPKFYEQMLDIFPEIVVQDRYWGEFDRYGIIDKYEPSFKGILDYIEKEIKSPEQRQLAKKRMFESKRMREKAMKKGTRNNFGGYPILHIFKAMVNGDYKRVLQPTMTPTKKEIEFESRVKK